MSRKITALLLAMLMLPFSAMNTLADENAPDLSINGISFSDDSPTGGDDITIGKSCLISGFVYIQTSMHKHDKGQFIKKQGFTHSPIILGDDVWLGAHSTIMPNCNLKQGTIVGSNAVVTKSSNLNEILAGVPAKKINIRS
mgnify:CR=1 FL=1